MDTIVLTPLENIVRLFTPSFDSRLAQECKRLEGSLFQRFMECRLFSILVSKQPLSEPSMLPSTTCRELVPRDLRHSVIRIGRQLLVSLG
jgi:hypothetical protein